MHQAIAAPTSTTKPAAAILRTLQAWITSRTIQIPVVARAMRAISLLKAFERADMIALRDDEGLTIEFGRNNELGWSCCGINTITAMGDRTSNTSAWDEGSPEANMHAALDHIAKQR